MNCVIDCRHFYRVLKQNGIGFFCGVPDSLLKDFCACVLDHAGAKHHVIAANEGNAVAMAAGYHLATGKTGLVYLQNSGLGNAANPLLSLADEEVYSIPILLLIGWRGEPGVPDEPQHRKQGKVTQEFLRALKIPHAILSANQNAAEKAVRKAVATMKKTGAPYALVVRKNTFIKYSTHPSGPRHPYPLSRRQAIHLIAGQAGARDVIVSTTGKASRELFAHREQAGEGHEKDFLTVGSMGHSSSIALALALSRPRRRVFCLDGDGAALMHLGAWAIAGTQRANKFIHIVLNNGMHESVGGQLTAGFDIDFCTLAKGCGYRHVLQAETARGVVQKLRALKAATGPSLLEIRLNRDVQKDLGRPTIGPIQNKRSFMAFVRGKR